METRSSRSSIRQSMLPSSGRHSVARSSVAGLSDSIAGMSLQGSSETSRASGIFRRTSTSIAGRQSLYGRPSGAGMGSVALTKDPRPIRDKQWQNNAIKTLIQFLVERGYSQALSPKSLQNCSTKDFKSIFTFLYSHLDPNFVFEKKFEEELPSLLKGLRYPFPDQFSRNSVYAIGSLHMWPTALAMLVWMVELIQCTEQMEIFPDIQDESGRTTANAERIFFDYLAKTYSSFLAGSDSFDSMDQELIGDFDRKNAAILADVEDLTKENESLQRELKKLTSSEAPRDTLNRTYKTLLEDRQKFQTYLSHIEGKKQKLQETVLNLQQELDAKNAEISKLTAEKTQLQETVDAQEISPSDLDRMIAEREQLGLYLDSTSAKLDQLNQMIWDKEIEVQKKMDQVEKSVQEYNGMLYKLGLFGASSSSSLGQELELNVQAQTVEGMVSVNLKSEIKPSLGKLKEEYSLMRHRTQDEHLALQEKLDSVSWSLSQKEEELSAINLKVKSLNDRYKEEKEHIGVTMQATVDEISQYERQSQRDKMESNALLLASQQRAQKITIEYDQLSRTYTAEKEKLSGRLAGALVAIYDFQTKLQNELRGLEQVAESHLSQIQNITIPV